MKNTFLIIFLLFSIKSMACMCHTSPIHEKYIKSDIVAKVKILKIYKNVDSYLYYKADVLVKKMYKGTEIKSIYIYGDNDGEHIGRSKTDCDIFLPEEAELMIYTSKNERGEYTLQMCSGYLDLNTSQKWRKEKNKLELKIVRKLKRKKITFTNKNNVIHPRGLYDSLKVFNDIKLRKHYAIFEITFKSFGSDRYEVLLDDIKVIRGFNKKLDIQLIDVLKKNKWYAEIKEGQSSRCLFVIKHIKATEKEPSHLIHFL